MWNRHGNPNYLYDALRELKEMVQPLVRLSSELESQNRNLRESVEKLDNKLDRMSEETHARIERSHSQHEADVKEIGERVTKIEQDQADQRGSRRTWNWLITVFGATVMAAAIAGANFTVTEIFSARERLAVIEKTVVPK
jgi:predicted RNase H-like nuclease (RuvC/YqgF family)